MEKTISQEERIRRAEEIYYRRKLKEGNVRMPSSQVTEGRENRQFSLYKKMVLQVLICILIYLIFSLIKDANYLFSEEVIGKTKEFLSKDINFTVISQQVGQFFKDNEQAFNQWLENTDQANKQEEQNQENKEGQDNNQNQEEDSDKQNVQNQVVQNEQTNSQTNQNEQTSNQASENNQTIGIGGASNEEQTVTTSSNGSSPKSQMQKDAEYIKKNFSMVLPAKAVITSHYGKREPTQIVSANHQGIDIGVTIGTTIVAAMEGKVSVVSDAGEYGTHVKIVNKDVTTIYAHCSKILVKQGASIKKGQKIALSGNTGKTTGPHLHFEIRRDQRTVDPELILSWT